MFDRSTLRVCTLLMAALAAACTPTTIYHREGTEVTRVYSELSTCQVTALSQVPVENRQRYIPPDYSYRSFCYSNGQCVSRRVLLRPGYFETYDANEPLRTNVTRSCMTDQGFSRVSLPQCSSDVVAATTITRTRVQPPITDTSCIIRIRSGGYQIVNP